MPFARSIKNLHVLAVNVRDFQVDNLANPQAHAIAQLQHRIVLEVGRGVQQFFDVLCMNGFWQDARFLGPGYFEEEFSAGALPVN